MAAVKNTTEVALSAAVAGEKLRKTYAQVTPEEASGGAVFSACTSGIRSENDSSRPAFGLESSLWPETPQRPATLGSGIGPLLPSLKSWQLEVQLGKLSSFFSSGVYYLCIKMCLS